MTESRATKPPPDATETNLSADTALTEPRSPDARKTLRLADVKARAKRQARNRKRKLRERRNKQRARDQPPQEIEAEIAYCVNIAMQNAGEN